MKRPALLLMLALILGESLAVINIKPQGLIPGLLALILCFAITRKFKVIYVMVFFMCIIGYCRIKTEDLTIQKTREIGKIIETDGRVSAIRKT